MGMAAGIKFLPFVLFPLLWKRLGLRQGLFILFIAFLVFSLPFLFVVNGDMIHHLGSSVALYFQTFEFNAGFYYLIRYLGFLVKGYNIIATAGWTLALTSAFIILFLVFRFRVDNWNTFFSLALISYLIYYLFATTVHPWYLVNVLFLACLSGRFLTALPWSFLVFFSYQAYSTAVVQEDTVLLLLEYAVVWTALVVEIINIMRSGELRHSRFLFDAK